MSQKPYHESVTQYLTFMGDSPQEVLRKAANYLEENDTFECDNLYLDSDEDGFLLSFCCRYKQITFDKIEDIKE